MLVIVYSSMGWVWHCTLFHLNLNDFDSLNLDQRMKNEFFRVVRPNGGFKEIDGTILVASSFLPKYDIFLFLCVFKHLYPHCCGCNGTSLSWLSSSSSATHTERITYFFLFLSELEVSFGITFLALYSCFDVWLFSLVFFDRLINFFYFSVFSW